LKENPMPKISKWLPELSLLVAGVSLVTIPIGSVIPSEHTRMFVFLALVIALGAVATGIAGLKATRGEDFGRRGPAFIGVGLGGLLTVWYAVVNWLMIPF
jgi:hypothetical protein